MSREEHKTPDELQPIDYVMSALENAYMSGMSLKEVLNVGCYAASIDKLDEAISLYSSLLGARDFPTTPYE